MSTQSESSLNQLKAESEHSRAAFVTSVDALRGKIDATTTEMKARISPDNLKEEVKQYLYSAKDDWVSSLKRRAKDNPLQAAAIGAGIAYPVWSMARRIPAPLLLIGAGFFLAHQTSSGSTEAEFTENLKKKANDAYSTGRKAAMDAVETVSKAAADAKATVVAAAEPVISQASVLAKDATATVTQLGQPTTDRAASAQDSAGTTLAEGKEAVARYATRSGNTIVDFVQQNPFLVAGVSMALGALVAASIPASESENRVLGGARDELKNQLKRSVATGMEQAAQVATGIVSDIASAAAEQGFTAESLKTVADGLTDSAKSVLSKGVDTALAGLAPHQQNSSGPLGAQGAKQ